MDAIGVMGFYFFALILGGVSLNTLMRQTECLESDSVFYWQPMKGSQ